MSPARPDYTIYLVTDRDLCLGRELSDVVCAALRGGARMVQLREKRARTREFVELGRQLLRLVHDAGGLLLVNDRVDVALAIGADGVHVGQDDMRPEDARALLGPNAIIGLSVETREQVRQAERLPVDYLGVSPVWATATKTDTKTPWGLEGLAQIRTMCRLPLVGIGGIGPDNAGLVAAAGADGVAVVSAICSAPDPAKAAQELRQAFLSTK